MKDTLIYLGLGTLFTHELDAMLNNEWRVLPILSMLSDDVGMVLFVVLHVPAFAGLIAWVASTDQARRRRGQMVISAFLVFHAIAHGTFLLLGVTNYEFESALSNSLIFGGAVCGLVWFAANLSETT